MIKLTERKLQRIDQKNGTSQYLITVPTKWINSIKAEKGEMMEWMINPEKPEEIIFRKAGEW